MIIIQGWGALVGLIGVAAIGAALDALGAARGLSYALGGVALAAFGWLVNANGPHHRLFGIPLQYWGLVIAIGAIAGL